MKGEEKVCDKRRCRRGIGRVSSSRGRWKNCGEEIARNDIFDSMYSILLD